MKETHEQQGNVNTITKQKEVVVEDPWWTNEREGSRAGGARRSRASGR